MPLPKIIAGRYEVLKTLGEGGMGVVYLARDAVVARDVALKTIRDVPGQMALELFRKECSVLAAMSHPNIVEIFDIGDFEDEGGARKPYFVMPLLRGDTLGQLIRGSSQCLTLERSIEIILQTCRGLQAAHELGLVHRDLKPNNIFVLPDDSVKIIDFGVAHMADIGATMTVKGGTLLYMAPEQIEMKPAAPSSDIFSLGVVFYEMLTGCRPFACPTEGEVIEAILHHTPVPASEVNPSVPIIYSRIIHKAMAKQPWHRFSSARELAETLQKAQRNEPIEIFDSSRLAPRLQRAAKALDQRNLEFAGEILGELESAGEVDAALSDLRYRLNAAVRQKTLSQLLESARNCMEEEELLLALQKIQEVLQLDPQNAIALGMRDAIELRRNEHKVEEWLQLARRHLERNAFAHAREALENILKISPGDATACQMLADAKRREEQFLEARKEKEELYQGALAAWKSGEISSALSKLERLIDLDRRVPDGGDTARSLSIQNFYKEVRSEQDLIRSAYEEARALLAGDNYAAAMEICQRYLEKFPGHALFQALRFDVEEKERQALSAQVAEIDRQVESEANLDRRVNLLRAAVEQHRNEPHFEHALRLARDKRDLVNGILAKKRVYEEQGQFNEALGQLEILGTIHREFPGLEFEAERLRKRHEQQILSEAKRRWVDQIDRHLETADYARAVDLIGKAMAEFPGDAEIVALESLARQSQARAEETRKLLRQGQERCAAGQYDEGIEVLRKAWRTDVHNPMARAPLLQALVEQARVQLENDWRAARRTIEEALEIDSTNNPAHCLLTLTQDREREESVTQISAACRSLQGEGKLEEALSLLEGGLRTYPREMRLAQLFKTIQRAMPATAGQHSLAASGEAQVCARASPPPSAVSPGTAPPANPLPAQAIFETEAPPAASHAPPMGATMILGADRGEALGVSSSAGAPSETESRGRGPALPGGRHMAKWASAAAVAFAAAIALPIAWFWPMPVDLRTNPAGATLRIDGTIRGQSNLHLKLRPGEHRVEISKTGYTSSSHVLNVRRWPSGLLNARLRAVEFELKPLPTLASLSIRGGVPGTEVRIDGRPVGAVAADGSFLNQEVWPGRHEIQLSARRFKSKRIYSDFKAGAPVVISEADACLESSTGVVRLTVVPADARVTYSRSGGRTQMASGTPIELEEGIYTITARAPGFAEQTRIIQVRAGRTETVTLRLSAQAAPVMTMDAWAKGAWTRAGVWYAHRGGEFVLFPAKPVWGSVVFSALRQTRVMANNRIQWVVNYRDSRNYLLFAVDKKNFYGTEVVSGKKREFAKVSLPAASAGDQLQYTFRIDISGSSVGHLLQSGSQWVPLHTMSYTAGTLSDGAFGFYLPGNEELLVSGFTFTPRH